LPLIRPAQVSATLAERAYLAPDKLTSDPVQAQRLSGVLAAALASARAEGLEPSAEDPALFAEVAAGRLSTDELRERVLFCYRR
jgi:Antitoxin VbhA